MTHVHFSHRSHYSLVRNASNSIHVANSVVVTLDAVGCSLVYSLAKEKHINTFTSTHWYISFCRGSGNTRICRSNVNRFHSIGHSFWLLEKTKLYLDWPQCMEMLLKRSGSCRIPRLFVTATKEAWRLLISPVITLSSGTNITACTVLVEELVCLLCFYRRCYH